MYYNKSCPSVCLSVRPVISQSEFCLVKKEIEFAFDMNVLDSDKGQGHFITNMLLTKRRHAGEKFYSDNSSSISKNKIFIYWMRIFYLLEIC